MKCVLKSFSVLGIKLSCIAGPLFMTLGTGAHAAPIYQKSSQNTPQYYRYTQKKPSRALSNQPAPVVSEKPKKSPFVASLGIEYLGTRLGGSPLDSYSDGYKKVNEAGPANIDYSLKLGYRLTDSNVLGIQIRGNQKLRYENENPAQGEELWGWRNFRTYFTWNNLIDTSFFSVNGNYGLEFPTTTSAHKDRLFVRTNIIHFINFKNLPKNWSFGTLAYFAYKFYQQPQPGQEDFFFILGPELGYQVSDSIELKAELNLDMSHNYQTTFFDFNNNEPDFFQPAVAWTINEHMNIKPAFRVFLDDFSWKHGIFFLEAGFAL